MKLSNNRKSFFLFDPCAGLKLINNTFGLFSIVAYTVIVCVWVFLNLFFSFSFFLSIFFYGFFASAFYALNLFYVIFTLSFFFDGYYK